MKTAKGEIELTPEIAQGVALGSAISAMLKDVDFAVAGAGLGLAIGEWLRKANLPADVEEAAVETILANVAVYLEKAR
jgi:hypothetical protein